MNAIELREVLTSQINLLKAGKADPKQVNAIVNAAGKVIASVRLEMEYARMIGVLPSIDFIRSGMSGKLAVKAAAKLAK
jgi:uncharacterized ParB-like nuclease family protein